MSTSALTLSPATIRRMAKASTTKNRSFEGRDVVGMKVAITNAGDGLSEAMLVDPIELHVGDKVFVVLEGEVTKVAHTVVKDTDVLNRVQTIRAGVATLVDEKLVKEVLDAQRLALEKAKGVERLDFEGANEGDEPK